MIAAAIPVGFFAGLFGIGGGLISVPFLFFIFELYGIDKEYLMHLTVGTAFTITILTSFSSVLTHKKHNAVDMSIIKSFGVFVIIGVVSGTIIASKMNTKSLVLFFAIMVYILGAYLLLVKNNNKSEENINEEYPYSEEKSTQGYNQLNFNYKLDLDELMDQMEKDHKIN